MSQSPAPPAHLLWHAAPSERGPVSAAAGSRGAIVGLVDNLEPCPTAAGHGGDATRRLLLGAETGPLSGCPTQSSSGNPCYCHCWQPFYDLLQDSLLQRWMVLEVVMCFLWSADQTGRQTQQIKNTMERNLSPEHVCSHVHYRFCKYLQFHGKYGCLCRLNHWYWVLSSC